MAGYNIVVHLPLYRLDYYTWSEKQSSIALCHRIFLPRRNDIPELISATSCLDNQDVWTIRLFLDLSRAGAFLQLWVLCRQPKVRITVCQLRGEKRAIFLIFSAALVYINFGWWPASVQSYSAISLSAKRRGSRKRRHSRFGPRRQLMSGFFLWAFCQEGLLSGQTSADKVITAAWYPVYQNAFRVTRNHRSKWQMDFSSELTAQRW